MFWVCFRCFNVRHGRVWAENKRSRELNVRAKKVDMQLFKSNPPQVSKVNFMWIQREKKNKIHYATRSLWCAWCAYCWMVMWYPASFFSGWPISLTDLKVSRAFEESILRCVWIHQAKQSANKQVQTNWPLSGHKTTVVARIAWLVIEMHMFI